jgi:hypothetical protein
MAVSEGGWDPARIPERTGCSVNILVRAWTVKDGAALEAAVARCVNCIHVRVSDRGSGASRSRALAVGMHLYVTRPDYRCPECTFQLIELDPQHSLQSS